MLALLTVLATVAADNAQYDEDVKPRDKAMGLLQDWEDEFDDYEGERAQVEFITGKRVLKGEFIRKELEKGGYQDLYRITSPANVAGVQLAAYSIPGRGDFQWIFLPDFNSMRHIEEGGLGETFLGTVMTYENFRAPYRLAGPPRYDHFYLREEEVVENDLLLKPKVVKKEDDDDEEAKPKTLKVHVLRRLPKDPRSPYKRELLWYVNKFGLPYKRESYSWDNKLVQTATWSGFELFDDDYWRAQTLEVEARGRKTVVVYTKRKLPIEVDKKEFAPPVNGKKKKKAR